MLPRQADQFLGLGRISREWLLDEYVFTMQQSLLRQLKMGSHRCGYDHAIDNTECADHGAFGFFGAQGDVHDLGTDNPGSNGRPGASKWQHPAASGATTGGNNSSLCGNGATPAPFTP